jgi:type IV fimbrial biogenesis protein FimT
MQLRAKWVFGFTLIELMVALGVLAVVMIAAAPSFADFIDKNRLRAAAEGAISLISNARAEAVKNDLDVSIAMTGSGADWCMGANAAVVPTGGNPAAAAASCNCTDSTACLVSGQRAAIDVGAYPEVLVGPLPAALTFDGNLGAIVPLGTRSLTLTSPTGKYDVTVEVNALGQAHLCVPTGKPVIAGVPSC